MITVKQLYDAYPDHDLLPPITAETTLNDLEEHVETGDTLFLFLCRELCHPADHISDEAAADRIRTAIMDLAAVRKQFIPSGPPHLAVILATHMGAIYEAQANTSFTLSPCLGLTIPFTCDGLREFRVDWGGTKTYLGNAHGAAQWYMQLALSSSRVVVLEDV